MSLKRTSCFHVVVFRYMSLKFRFTEYYTIVIIHKEIPFYLFDSNGRGESSVKQITAAQKTPVNVIWLKKKKKKDSKLIKRTNIWRWILDCPLVLIFQYR